MDRFELPWLGRRRGWLGAHAARARRRPVLDGGDAAALGARRVRAARRPRRLAVGVAGRRRRRLPHRPAAGRRARLRLVADRARLPARDDPLGRRRADLGRPAPGRRLELARGLSRDGARSWPARRCSRRCSRRAWSRAREAVERRPQRPARLPRRRRRGRRSASSSPAMRSRRARVRSSRRCSRRSGDRRRRCPSAGPTCSRSCRHRRDAAAGRRGRRGRRASRPCSAAWRATSRSPARCRSSPSSSSTSSATRSPASLLTPFLLQAMHYGTAEVGVVNKVIGLWLTIGGALLGGALMLRLGLWRALMLFGILQMPGNLGFWWLAVHGRDALPGLVDPGVRLGLRQARRADAGRRRPADGDREREPHQRHGHGGVRRVPDEPVQPALQRDPVRAAERVRVDRPGLGRAARRRAGAVDRLAGVLPRLDRRRRCRRWSCSPCCAGRSRCWSATRDAQPADD